MVNDASENNRLNRARDLALAEAFAGGSRVLATLAARFRDMHPDDEPAPAQAHAKKAQPATKTTGTATTKAKAAKKAGQPAGKKKASAGTRTGLGRRQTEILALGGFATLEGLNSNQVAAALGIAQSNAHNALSSLEGLGLLARVPDVSPAHWRNPDA